MGRIFEVVGYGKGGLGIKKRDLAEWRRILREFWVERSRNC